MVRASELSNMKLLVVGLTLIVMGACEADNASILGRLAWCDTLCLCDKATERQAHCFKSDEIYSLVQIYESRVKRLERTGFDLEEKLMWCSDNCLCHKGTHKEFQCTDPRNMRRVLDMAPNLAPYFETRQNDNTENPSAAEDFGITEESKGRKGRKKNRKHRKNKKKHQEDRRALTDDTISSMADQLKEVVSAHKTMVLLQPQETQSVSTLGRLTQETQTFQHQMDETSASLTKINEDLETLKHNITRLEIQMIKGDTILYSIQMAVQLNTLILYICSAVAAALLLGFIILSIIICCQTGTRRKSEKSHVESIGKGNISEAW